MTPEKQHDYHRKISSISLSPPGQKHAHYQNRKIQPQGRGRKSRMAYCVRKIDFYGEIFKMQRGT
jgi:hypothetical protein